RRAPPLSQHPLVGSPGAARNWKSRRRRHPRPQARGRVMTKAEKQADEMAALLARVAELERAAKPPEPFKPEPYQRYDPTANMCMPRSALQAMVAAEPRGFMSGVVHDNRAPTGRPGMIPSASSQGGGPANVPGSGTGWAREIPLGPPAGIRYVDQQLDAQDAKDRRELIEQKVREQALLKAAEPKS